jgi:hypothetical protein
MGPANRFAPFVALIVLFAVLQPLLIAVDLQQTPARAAKAFIRDYYYLDPAMQKWLCTDPAESREAVDAYLQFKKDEAAQRGFDVSYTRHMFTKLHVETLSREEDSARVHISGTTRVAINPVFMVIGKLFGLGRDYPVDVTLELVQQNGRWRVCGSAL